MGEMFRRNQVPGLIVQRRMHGNHICAADQFFERDQSGAEISGTLFADIWVIDHDVHLEGPRAQCHPATDFTKTNNAHRLVLQLVAGKWCALPLPAFQAGIGHRDVAAHGQQDRHGMFRRRVGIAKRCVDDNDATLAGSLDIDIIDADACPGYHFQAAGMLQQLGIDLGPGTGNDRIIITDYFVQLRLLKAKPHIQLDPGIVLQKLQPLLGNFVGNNDFHGSVILGQLSICDFYLRESGLSRRPTSVIDFCRP